MRPTDSLFYIYALLPLAIGMIAEQLRLAAAEQVPGLAGAGERPGMRWASCAEDEQRSSRGTGAPAGGGL